MSKLWSLDCDAMQWCGRIPTFWNTMLSPSIPLRSCHITVWWHQNSEDHNLNFHHRENLKYHTR